MNTALLEALEASVGEEWDAGPFVLSQNAIDRWKWCCGTVAQAPASARSADIPLGLLGTFARDWKGDRHAQVGVRLKELGLRASMTRLLSITRLHPWSVGACLSARSRVTSAQQIEQKRFGRAVEVTVQSDFFNEEDVVIGSVTESRTFFANPVVPSALKRAEPMVGLDNAFWWEGIAAEELRVQQCAQCSMLRHPPRPMCPACHSLEWSHRVSSGRGVVHSFTIHHAHLEGLGKPYVVALIELDEGTRFVSNIVDADPASVYIGMLVQVAFRRMGSTRALPLFRPLSESGTLEVADASELGRAAAMTVHLDANRLFEGAVCAGSPYLVYCDPAATVAEGTLKIHLDAMIAAGLVERTLQASSECFQARSIQVAFDEPVHADTALDFQVDPQDDGNSEQVRVRAVCGDKPFFEATICGSAL